METKLDCIDQIEKRLDDLLKWDKKVIALLKCLVENKEKEESEEETPAPCPPAPAATPRHLKQEWTPVNTKRGKCKMRPPPPTGRKESPKYLFRPGRTHDSSDEDDDDSSDEDEVRKEDKEEKEG